MILLILCCSEKMLGRGRGYPEPVHSLLFMGLRSRIENRGKTAHHFASNTGTFCTGRSKRFWGGSHGGAADRGEEGVAGRRCKIRKRRGSDLGVSGEKACLRQLHAESQLPDCSSLGRNRKR